MIENHRPVVVAQIDLGVAAYVSSGVTAFVFVSGVAAFVLGEGEDLVTGETSEWWRQR